MLLRHLIARTLHTARPRLSAAAATTDKTPSALATLRKKTGYTFANCKKALQLHPNDLAAAEKWLAEQAQSLGWSKATKLEGRATRQGLVAVLVQRNIGAMLEVNCETDFVARNETFQEFVRSATRACAQHAAQLPTNAASANGHGAGSLSKLDFDAEYLRQVQLDGRSLPDQLALIIGKVGENATLRRATCFRGEQGVRLAAFAHPAAKTEAEEEAAGAEAAVLLGKFGALVAVKEVEKQQQPEDVETQELPSADELARNLGQHIVGMNPARIGVDGVDKPAEVKDDERSLIWQEYLLEPAMQVHEILAENGLEVVDFKRFECGELLEAEKEKEKAAEVATSAEQTATA